MNVLLVFMLLLAMRGALSQDAPAPQAPSKPLATWLIILIIVLSGCAALACLVFCCCFRRICCSCWCSACCCSAREMEKEEPQTGLSGEAGEVKANTFIFPSVDFKQTSGIARPNQTKMPKPDADSAAGAV